MSNSPPEAKATSPPTATDIAWAAGLFEGEGSFAKAGNTPSITIQMNDLDIILRFGAIIQVGKLLGPYRYGVQRQDSWKWTAHGIDNYQHVLNLFTPHLGTRRTARAKEILQWAEQRRGYRWATGIPSVKKGQKRGPNQ